MATAVLLTLGLGASAAYTVRPGDTLSGIAERLGVSVRALASANSLNDPDRVLAGRRLQVPGGELPAAGAGVAPGGTLSRLHRSPARLALVPHFRHWAAANGIPADLLMATTWMESGWQSDVVSHAGARGIGQLMPGTAAFIREELIGVPTLDAGDPVDNIRMSARYLRWLLSRAGGDARTALAGYYQGPASVAAVGAKPDTVVYVEGVLALRRHFA